MNRNLIFLDEELPNPLNEIDTLKLFKDVKQGNKEARDTLINHNIKLVIYKVNNRFDNSQYDKNELVSIGIIGLIKSIDNFDPSKKISFSTFAGKCIENEILCFIRTNKKHNNIDNNIELDKEDGHEINFIRLFEQNTNNIELNYERTETIAIIKDIVNSIKGRNGKIIKLYFGFYDNILYKQKDIAKLYNISNTQVSRIIAKELNEIKLKLIRIGIIEPTKKRIKSK